MTYFLPLIVCLTAPVPATDAAVLKKEQDEAWTWLMANDLNTTRAIIKFSAKPKETTAYFKDKLKPLTLEEKTAKKLIADLSSEDEKVWKPAIETFEYLDPRLALTLQSAFDESTPGDGRGRLVMVLGDQPVKTLKHYNTAKIQLRATGDDSYNFFDGTTSWWAEHKVSRLNAGSGWNSKRQWSRANRAIVILEHFGTEDAIVILKNMATGHAEAGPTIAANDSLKRLGQTK
jgi:hypothetical protein